MLLRIHFTWLSKISGLDGDLCTHCNSEMKMVVQSVKRIKKKLNSHIHEISSPFLISYTFLILIIPSVEM